MNDDAKLEKLKHFQSEVDALRGEIGIRAPGTVLYQSQASDDAFVIVVADGFGRATASVVEGNYPIDYVTRYERLFESESEAAEVAEKLASGRWVPTDLQRARP